MPSILVTGASGWIGGYVIREIQSRGIDVIATSDRPRPEEGIHHLDVTDVGAVHGVVKRLRPDAIINLAGHLGTEELIGREYAAAATNVLGAINVYDAARDVDARVVQIGTGHKGQPNTYAVTKACAEDLALIRARETGQDIVVVRAYHAYGPGQGVPRPHGEAHVRKIIPSFICRALTDMPIEIFGDGKNLIDLVYVGHVATVLVDAAERGEAGDLIEAGVGVELAVVDVAADVIAACDSHSTVRFLPPRPGEPVGARAVAGHPACALPWPHRLDETIEYYRRWLGDNR